MHGETWLGGGSWSSSCSPTGIEIFQELTNGMVMFIPEAENQPCPPDLKYLLFLVHFPSFENFPFFPDPYSTNIHETRVNHSEGAAESKSHSLTI